MLPELDDTHEIILKPPQEIIGGIAAHTVAEQVEVTEVQRDASSLIGEIQKDHPEIENRAYQVECLDILARIREQGQEKALIHMATGLGKTTIAATEAKRYLQENPEACILFLCHQNEILRQARSRFESIIGSERYNYGTFTGETKDTHKVACLFASFQTMKDWRQYFAEDEFDYVVVDESHHGKAGTYEPTLQYFKPKFMLGMTATPDRKDLQDIREIFGHEVYSKPLAQALAEGLLARPDYRVILDDIQEGVLEDPRINLADLNRTVFIPKRDEEIARIIQERIKDIPNAKIIGFSPSIEHARRIADLLPSTKAFHSELKPAERQSTLEEFRNAESAGLITVDMFNEGMDIAEANIIVFLRSTQSETVFLQQLGRGLRKLPNKESVLVLDFVANCDRLLMIEKLLHDAAGSHRKKKGNDSIMNPDQDLGFGEDEEVDIYMLDFETVKDDAEALQELQLGSFEFTETTRKIMNIIKKIHSRKTLYNQWNADYSINYYRKLSEALGRPATPTDIQQASTDQQGPSLTLLARDFDGKIINLRKAAGFEEELRRFWPNWTAKDSIIYYRELSENLGRPARVSDLSKASQEGYGPSHMTLLKPFGKSIQKLKEAAGYTPRGKGIEWSLEDSVRYYQELSSQLGRPAIDADIREASKAGVGPSPTQLLRDFDGKISKLRAAAEVEAPDSRSWSDEQFLEYYKHLSEELGKPAGVKDINNAFQDGRGPGFMSFYKRFGSIDTLRVKSGIETKHGYKEWSKEEFIQYYNTLCTQLGKIATIKDINAASSQGLGPSYRSIARYFGSINKLQA